MFLLALLAIVLLSLTLSLHYIQHFNIKCCPTRVIILPSSTYSHAKSVSNTRNSIASATPSPSSLTLYPPGTKFKRTFHCICRTTDDETPQFYPSSFLLYIIFMIILTLAVIVIEMLNHFDHSQIDTHNEWLYGFELYSYNEHSISTLHRFQTSESSKQSTVVFVVDLLLIFGVMILAVWESLFTFYRYYTTLQTTVNLELISTETVLKKFIIYPILFCILFLVQISIYYWLWPLIVLLHCIFNGYFSYQFAALLINSYKMFDEIGQCMMAHGSDANKTILESVYIMRRASLICAIVQCIYLSLFVVTYNMNTVYYLPVLWSISCTVFAFNFARNRTTVHHMFIRLSKVCHSNNVHAQPQTNTKINSTVVLQMHPEPIDKTDKDVHVQHAPIYTNPLYSTDHLTANGSAANDINDNEFQSEEDRTNSWRVRHFSEVVQVKTDIYEHSERTSGGAKAMKLLGLDQSSKQSNSKSLKAKVSNSLRGALYAIQSNSAKKSSSLKHSNSKSMKNTGSNQREKMEKLITECDTALFSDDKSNKSNKSEHDLNDTDDELIMVDVAQTYAISSDDGHNPDEVDYGSDNELPELAEMDEESSKDIVHVSPEPVPKPKAQNTVPSIENEYEKKSDHLKQNEAQYAEAFRKLNALAAIGFCSVKDLNSFDQIKQYNQHLFESSFGKHDMQRSSTGRRLGLPQLLKKQSVSDRNLTAHKNAKDRTTKFGKNLSASFSSFVPKLMKKVRFRSDTKNTTSDVMRARSDNPQPTSKKKPIDTTMDFSKTRSVGSNPKQKKKRFGF